MPSIRHFVSYALGAQAAQMNHESQAAQMNHELPTVNVVLRNNRSDGAATVADTPVLVSNPSGISSDDQPQAVPVMGKIRSKYDSNALGSFDEDPLALFVDELEAGRQGAAGHDESFDELEETKDASSSNRCPNLHLSMSQKNFAFEVCRSKQQMQNEQHNPSGALQLLRHVSISYEDQSNQGEINQCEYQVEVPQSQLQEALQEAERSKFMTLDELIAVAQPLRGANFDPNRDLLEWSDDSSEEEPEEEREPSDEEILERLMEQEARDGPAPLQRRNATIYMPIRVNCLYG